MSAERLRATLFGLLVLAAALALVGTIAASPVAGWLGVAALVAALAVYVQWRRAVRRRRVTGE
ncbi:MAG: hypothetical protein M3321_06215 [Actinomycetota bacterium]|nr:hypothetical protein [Actinomycetota bacterium]